MRDTEAWRSRRTDPCGDRLSSRTACWVFGGGLSGAISVSPTVRMRPWPWASCPHAQKELRSRELALDLLHQFLVGAAATPFLDLFKTDVSRIADSESIDLQSREASVPCGDKDLDAFNDSSGHEAAVGQVVHAISLPFEHQSLALTRFFSELVARQDRARGRLDFADGTIREILCGEMAGRGGLGGFAAGANHDQEEARSLEQTGPAPIRLTGLIKQLRHGLSLGYRPSAVEPAAGSQESRDVSSPRRAVIRLANSGQGES